MYIAFLCFFFFVVVADCITQMYLWEHRLLGSLWLWTQAAICSGCLAIVVLLASATWKMLAFHRLTSPFLQEVTTSFSITRGIWRAEAQPTNPLNLYRFIKTNLFRFLWNRVYHWIYTVPIHLPQVLASDAVTIVALNPAAVLLLLQLFVLIRFPSLPPQPRREHCYKTCFISSQRMRI